MMPGEALGDAIIWLHTSISWALKREKTHQFCGSYGSSLCHPPRERDERAILFRCFEELPSRGSCNPGRLGAGAVLVDALESSYVKAGLGPLARRVASAQSMPQLAIGGGLHRDTVAG